MSKIKPLSEKQGYPTFSIIDGDGKTLCFFSFQVVPGIKGEPFNALALTASKFKKRGSKKEIIFSKPEIVVTVAEFLSRPETKFSNDDELTKAITEKKMQMCQSAAAPSGYWFGRKAWS